MYLDAKKPTALTAAVVGISAKMEPMRVTSWNIQNTASLTISPRSEARSAVLPRQRCGSITPHCRAHGAGQKAAAQIEAVTVIVMKVAMPDTLGSLAPSQGRLLRPKPSVNR
jgi:hypothetical protein